jgi:hypothetical protein
MTYIPATRRNAPVSSTVRVPAFANPEQLLLAPGGIFARDDAEPG